MRKTTILATLIVLVFFVADCRPTKESPEESTAYPVTIKNVDGIRNILNPDFPKDGSIRYELSEELTIGGGEGSEEEVLNRPIYLDVDSDGNIYVMDLGDIDIKVFTPEGKLARTIGRKGQGPGEFDTPASFKISKDNTIFLLSGSQRRFSLLKLTGEYITGFGFDGFSSDMYIDSSNRVYYSVLLPPEKALTEDYQMEETRFALNRSDVDGQNKIKLGEFKDKSIMRKVVKTASGATMMGGISREAYTTVWIVGPKDRVYIGYNKDYKIDVYDPDWNLMFRFGRAYTPIKHPEYSLESIDPEYYPAFSYWRKFFDDKENLWLEQYTAEGVEEHVYDVFTSEGIYLKQILVPETLCLVRGEKAYSIIRTKEEYLIVKRFRMTEAGRKEEQEP